MPRVRIEFPEPALFRHELQVRISDINYGNHLGHDALVSLLHEARVQLFRHLGQAEDNCDGAAMVIADLAVRYRSEAFAGQTLVVEVGAGERRPSSCELVYRVSQKENGREVALARTGIVFVDQITRQVVSLPAAMAALLSFAP